MRDSRKKVSTPAVPGREGRPRRPHPRSGDIGYGRPPKATQFRPGQSGNPKGRPKGSRNLGTRVTSILNSTVVKKEGNRSVKVTVLEGLLWKHIENGFKGSERAFNSVFKLARDLGMLDQSRDAPATQLSSAEQRIIDEFLSKVSTDAEDD